MNTHQQKPKVLEASQKTLFGYGNQRKQNSVIPTFMSPRKVFFILIIFVLPQSKTDICFAFTLPQPLLCRSSRSLRTRTSSIVFCTDTLVKQRPSQISEVFCFGSLVFVVFQKFGVERINDFRHIDESPPCLLCVLGTILSKSREARYQDYWMKNCELFL